MKWTVEFLNEEVKAEFQELPRDLQACLQRIISLILDDGLENVGMPYVRHIQGKLWAIRGHSKDGIVRSIYVTASGRRVIIVRSFIKKTQGTPVQEIRIALKRARELLP